MPGTHDACGPILVVDDDESVLTLVAAVLELDHHDVVVAGTGEEALALARERPPRLAVLDVNLPGVSGYELCHALKREQPDVVVVFLSGERIESFDRVAGLLLGADDYLTKPFAPDELLARIRNVLRRKTSEARETLLTRRELEVLRLLADGRTQKEIALLLVISPKTVASHISRILEKLGVHSRAEAVAVAFRLDLVQA